MPLPLILGGIILGKKKKNREYAKWVETFPVTEDCVAMDDLIKQAEARYKQEDKEYRETKKIKIQVRINQKRERDTLGEYLNDLRNYRKDLVCGITSGVPSAPTATTLAPASNTTLAQTTLVPAQLVNTGNTNAPGGGLALVPNQQIMQEMMSPQSAEAPVQGEQKPAAKSDKVFMGLTKKQLLIGAAVVAAGGAVVYFMRKN